MFQNYTPPIDVLRYDASYSTTAITRKNLENSSKLSVYMRECGRTFTFVRMRECGHTFVHGIDNIVGYISVSWAFDTLNLQQITYASQYTLENFFGDFAGMIGTLMGLDMVKVAAGAYVAYLIYVDDSPTHLYTLLYPYLAHLCVCYERSPSVSALSRLFLFLHSHSCIAHKMIH